MKTETLTPGNYYHIYNRGNNKGDIFFEEENYRHFLRLYHKFVSPVADTYAWCLMKNHFHFLIYLKNEEEIFACQSLDQPKTLLLSASRQFSHCFNSYTQAINKRYKRTGSLFEKSVQRKHVKSEKYFRQLIFYIHNNPVHHEISRNIGDYEWSSYRTCLTERPTKLKRKEVINIFDDLDNFVFYHKKSHDLKEINSLTFD